MCDMIVTRLYKTNVQVLGGGRGLYRLVFFFWGFYYQIEAYNSLHRHRGMIRSVFPVISFCWMIWMGMFKFKLQTRLKISIIRKVITINKIILIIKTSYQIPLRNRWQVKWFIVFDYFCFPLSSTVPNFWDAVDSWKAAPQSTCLSEH